MQQSFNDEYVIIDFQYGDYRVESRATMYLMDSLGNIKEVAIEGEIGWNWSESYSVLHDGICVLYQTDSDDYLVAYDIKNNSFTTMTDYYAKRTNWDNYSKDNCFNGFINNRILIPLTGDDGKAYAVLLDKNWNAVSEPVRADSYFYSDGRFIAYQTHYNASSYSNTIDNVTVYDENCKKLFNMSDIGFSGYQIYGYSDGVARIIKSGTTKYIDKNGELLFSEIDMNTAILK